MQFFPKAGADRRVLVSAVMLSTGLGLGLGATYMGAGLHHSGADRAQRIAEAANGNYSEDVLRYQIAGDPAVVRLAEQTGEDRPLFPALNLRGFQHDEPAQQVQPATQKRDLDCLTQAVYFEARGESARGQQAVAQVVMNRVKSPAYPKTVCGVVYQGASLRKGCQFSFACDGSMRRTREGAAWTEARRVAARVLAGAVLADVGGATHFHTTAVSPNWGPQMLRVSQVGLHVFYKTGPRRAAPAAPAMDVERAVFVSLPAKDAVKPLQLVSSISDAAAGQKAEPIELHTVDAKAPAAAAPAVKSAPEARTISAVTAEQDHAAS